jgi:WD40 repeat protein
MLTIGDPTKLKVVKDISRPGILFSLARPVGSTRLFCGCSDGKVYDLDIAAEKPEAKEFVGHESYVTGLALAGGALVSASWDGSLIWWNIETREQIRKVTAHAKWIRGITASPDGKLISSVSDDMTCKLWNAETGELVRTLQGHEPITPHHYPSMLFVSAFSADGRFLATADKVGHVVIWNVETGSKLAAVEAPLMYTWDPRQRRHSIGGIRSLAFSPDGKLLATGGIGQIENIDHLGAAARIEVFDWQAGQRTHEFPGDNFKGLVEQLAFAPGGEMLIATGGDNGGFIKFVDLKNNKIIHQDKTPMHVYAMSVGETWDKLYAVGHGKIVVLEFKADVPAPAAEAAAATESKSP